MADFRIHLTHDPGDPQMLIRAQVWAPEWLAERLTEEEKAAKADEPPRYDWFTADEWVAPTRTRLTAKFIRNLCAERGWTVTGDSARSSKDGALVVPVAPEDWPKVMQAAVAYRAATKRAWEAAETAWMGLVAAVPAKKQPGYVAAIQLAEMAGVTRFRIYQIQDRVAGAEGKLVEASKKRPRRRGTTTS